MSLSDQLVAIYVVCAAPWLIVSWLRLPRYVRYFQEEGHDFERFGAWLSQDKAESRYACLSIIGLILLCLLSCGAIFFLADFLFQNPMLAFVAYWLVLLIAWGFAPHDHLGGTLTSRARWLLVTTFFAELIPTIIGLSIISWVYDVVADPKNSPESMIVLPAAGAFILLVTITAGPISFLITPYMLVLANAINSPIEKLIARIAH